LGRLEALLALADEVILAIVVTVVTAAVLRAFNVVPSLPLFIATALIVVVLLVIGYRAAVAQLRKPALGAEAFAGKVAEVVEDLAPEGIVKLEGELWRAELLGGGTARAGSRVVVEGVEGLKLLVRPLERKKSAPEEPG